MNRVSARRRSVETRGRLSVVRVIVPQVFDPSSGEALYGGSERYLLELVRIVRRNLGYEVEILQPATGDTWVRRYEEMTVRGVQTESYFDLERDIYAQGFQPPLLTIHLAFYSASAYTTPPAVGISHGVYWDDPYYHTDEQRLAWHQARIGEALKHLDLVVSVDTNTINWVSATWPELGRKLVYVPNFVDLRQFRPRKRRWSSRVVVLFPRRLVTPRGFWLMAEIMPVLLHRYPELQFHFVGQASGPELTEINRLLAAHPRRMMWKVAAPHEMPRVYQTADIVVVPTLASEGTSLACLEAQSCGKCVIATRVGGLANLVINEFNGLLVEPTAPSVMAAIERVLLDPDLRTRLGAKAREMAEVFRIERWQQRWEDILRTFLPPRGR